MWICDRSRTTTVYVPVLIDLTALPAAVFSAIEKPGPDVSWSFDRGVTTFDGGFVGGGVVTFPTVNEPRICPWCGSQT